MKKMRKGLQPQFHFRKVAVPGDKSDPKNSARVWRWRVSAIINDHKTGHKFSIEWDWQSKEFDTLQEAHNWAEELLAEVREYCANQDEEEKAKQPFVPAPNRSNKDWAEAITKSVEADSTKWPDGLAH